MAEQILSKLFDANSFVQTEAYLSSELGIPGDGVITGYGAVGGRLVYAAACDGASEAGALGSVQAGKIARAVTLAVSNGAPFLFVIDSPGLRLAEGISALTGCGQIAKALTKASGVVPLIAVVSGRCAGVLAALAGLCDFIVMNRASGFLSLSGERVAKGKGGYFECKEPFGSGAFHAISGGATVVTETEEEMGGTVRSLLQLLPDNRESGAPSFESADSPERFCAEIGPSQGDTGAGLLRDAVRAVTDTDTPFVELGREHEGNMLCALSTVGGITCGLIAAGAEGKPEIGGAACEKAASFLEFCDAFRIPVVTFLNAEGFAASLAEEKRFAAGDAAGLFYAYAASGVPKISIVTEKAYGGVYLAMGSKVMGADYTAAWENADIAPLSPEACVEILYREEILASADPDACRKEKTEEYRKQYAGPMASAARGETDAIIAPGETRACIASALMMLSGKRFPGGSQERP